MGKVSKAGGVDSVGGMSKPIQREVDETASGGRPRGFGSVTDCRPPWRFRPVSRDPGLCSRMREGYVDHLMGEEKSDDGDNAGC